MTEWQCEIAGPDLVECSVCHCTKAPRGRSASPYGPVHCDWSCAGHTKNPQPSHLWPGELCRDNYCQHKAPETA